MKMLENKETKTNQEMITDSFELNGHVKINNKIGHCVEFFLKEIDHNGIKVPLAKPLRVFRIDLPEKFEKIKMFFKTSGEAHEALENWQVDNLPTIDQAKIKLAVCQRVNKKTVSLQKMIEKYADRLDHAESSSFINLLDRLENYSSEIYQSIDKDLLIAQEMELQKALSEV